MTSIPWPATVGLRSFKRRERQADVSGYLRFIHRRSLTHAPSAGVGRRRPCVEAIETSSRADGGSNRPFVEPEWLFPSNDGINLRDGSEIQNKEDRTSLKSSLTNQEETSRATLALYYIVISTAKDDKSGLSEPSTGISFTIIGENGKALMHRISGVEFSNAEDKQSLERTPKLESSMRFQRGATDIVTLVGPDLGRLAAVWIAPEAGTWRIEKAIVTIFPWAEKLVTEDKPSLDELASLSKSNWLKDSANNEVPNSKFRLHIFESDEALIGDDAWSAAVELKPNFIGEFSDAAEVKERMPNISPPRSTQLATELRDQSMEEYKILKLSLLGFSSLLVVTGTASLAALGQGKLAEGFAVGGVGGFCYLLLLQRAVDQLPGYGTSIKLNKRNAVEQVTEERIGEVGNGDKFSNSTSSASNSEISSEKGRGDLGLPGRVTFVIGTILVLGRLTQGGAAASTISPPELLAGIMGFLTSKIAVVLAALKPIPLPQDDHK